MLAAASLLAFGLLSTAPGDSGAARYGKSETKSSVGSADDDGWTQGKQDAILPTKLAAYDAARQFSGYLDIGVDYARMHVLVYFHGPFPSELLDNVEKLEYPVDPVPVAFGSSTLRTVTVGIESYFAANNVAWSEIGTNASFTAITIAGPDISSDSVLQESTTKALNPLLQGIPVQYVSFRGYPVARSLSRQNDANPFAGAAGAVADLDNDLEVECTYNSAFHSGSGSTEKYYLLIAAHCAENKNYQKFYTGNGSKYIGQNSYTTALYTANNNHLDATLIKVDSPNASAPYIYDGAWNTPNFRLVSGAQPFAMGDHGCISGAFGGSRCGVVRDGTATTDHNTKDPQTGQLTAYRGFGVKYAYSVEGDSGGPIYLNSANNSVSILGIESSAFESSTAPCDANHKPGSGPCSTLDYVTPINEVQSILSASNIAITS